MLLAVEASGTGSPGLESWKVEVATTSRKATNISGSYRCRRCTGALMLEVPILYIAQFQNQIDFCCSGKRPISVSSLRKPRIWTLPPGCLCLCLCLRLRWDGIAICHRPRWHWWRRITLRPRAFVHTIVLPNSLATAATWSSFITLFPVSYLPRRSSVMVDSPVSSRTDNSYSYFPHVANRRSIEPADPAARV